MANSTTLSTVQPETNYSTAGIETYAIPAFTFHGTARTVPIKVAYRSFNPGGSKTALVPTCYSGRINETSNYTSSCLRGYHVVVAAMLGNGESSSPSNDADFPARIVYQDVIHAHHELLTKGLGIARLDVVVGFSMGGQQAYYWACLHPAFVRAVVPVCGSARTSPHNVAFLEGPKAALLHSVDYADGRYRSTGVWPARGLRAFGRAYCAWAFSAAWYRQRLWESAMGFASVEEQIRAWEESMVGWDPEDLLVMARMWQAGDVGSTVEGVVKEGGRYEEALRRIEARVLVMPSRTDQYFPPEDSEIEVSHLRRGELAVIETVWGHVGGGGMSPKDDVWIAERIAKFLNEEETGG